MTRSSAPLALALALVGCGAPVPAGDAGADVVTYAIAGRWVASSPELVPPSTWELEVDNMLRGTVTVTTPEACGGETRAYIARSLRFVGVREYVAERGTCQSSSSTCAAMASSSAVIEHGCARVGRAFVEGGRVVLSADHATVTVDGLAGAQLVFTRPQ